MARRHSALVWMLRSCERGGIKWDWSKSVQLQTCTPARQPSRHPVRPGVQAAQARCASKLILIHSLFSGSQLYRRAPASGCGGCLSWREPDMFWACVMFAQLDGPLHGLLKWITLTGINLHVRPCTHLWQCHEEGPDASGQVARCTEVLVHLPPLTKLLQPVVKLAGHNDLYSSGKAPSNQWSDCSKGFSILGTLKRPSMQFTGQNTSCNMGQGASLSTVKNHQQFCPGAEQGGSHQRA